MDVVELARVVQSMALKAQAWDELKSIIDARENRDELIQDCSDCFYRKHPDFAPAPRECHLLDDVKVLMEDAMFGARQVLDQRLPYNPY